MAIFVMMKKLLILMLATVALQGCVAGNMMCRRILAPERDPQALAKSREFAVNTYPYIKEWLDSMETNGVLRDTSIVTSDGLVKHAFYAEAPARSSRTAIIVHGYFSTPYKMMMLGNFYREQMGWNILIPHMEYHGLSEGQDIQMGWFDRIDVKEWADVAHRRFSDTLQVIHGISMGGATVMMLSGDDDLPPYIRGMVEDCGYTSVWDEFKYQAKQMFHIPAWPVLYSMEKVCRRKYGWDFHEASSVEQLRHSTLPMLFIHGDADDFVPAEMARTNFDAKTQGYKELWMAEGSPHAMSWRDHPKEYASKVKEFISGHVL